MKASQIEEQYRKIVFVDWRKEPPFKTEGLPVDDAEKFWFGILHHSSVKDLAAYALNCLITPISNAAVERIFSLVTACKTKPRNRMQVTMLDSIVRIRSVLLFSKICCKDFVPFAAMLRRFKSNTVYCYDDQSSLQYFAVIMWMIFKVFFNRDLQSSIVYFGISLFVVMHHVFVRYYLKMCSSLIFMKSCMIARICLHIDM